MGHFSILVMIGDLMIRLFEMQPEETNPYDLKGVVFIDELEIHLHPSWQIQFPHTLSKIFSRIQFVASTHSILPFMEIPRNSLFLNVKRDKKGNTQLEKLNIDVTRLTPTSLLTSPCLVLNLFFMLKNWISNKFILPITSVRLRLPKILIVISKPQQKKMEIYL